jgi:hypothetical protein
MKLDTSDKIVTEFVCLRNKMYSFKFQDLAGKKIAKGITKNVKENNLTHDDYLSTLMTKVNKKITQNTIQSYNHKVYSVSQTRTGLSGVNDKKYLLEDGISGYSYGHYSIPKN